MKENCYKQESAKLWLDPDVRVAENLGYSRHELRIIMSMHLKFCGCHHCRRGLRTKAGGEIVKRTIRKFRRVTKQQLKRGEEPLTKLIEELPFESETLNLEP